MSRIRPLLCGLTVLLIAAGCATAPKAPSVNVTGRWTGTYEGKGFGMVRTGAAEAHFTQTGATGTGTIGFAYGPGDGPQPVLITVAGNQVRAEHRMGAQYLTVVLTVDADTMTGAITSSDVPFPVKLRRTPQGG